MTEVRAFLRLGRFELEFDKRLWMRYHLELDITRIHSLCTLSLL